MADRYPLIVDSSSENIKELPTGDAILFLDNEKIKVGTGSDLTLYHDASNSYITNAVGALKVATETSGIAVTIGHTTSETTVGDNLTVTGDFSVGGNFDVTGTLDFSDSAISNVGDISLDSISGDADANTSITFSGSDVITIATGGSGRLTIGDGALSPVTDNQIDLGTASLEFKDAYFDGTVTADAFAGPLTGNVTGDASGSALTVTQAAQSSITSLGTLTTLTVDNVIINGSTIGHTGDTDLMTVASGALTVAGSIDATNLTISSAQGSDGQLLTSTGSGVAWETSSAATTGKAIAMAIVFG